MKKGKLIFSIFLMILFISITIILPSLWKKEALKDDDVIEIPLIEENIETLPDNTDISHSLTFKNTEHLVSFFSLGQIENLKTQLCLYLEQTVRPDITSVSFLPEATTYPDGAEILLQFILSDDSILPVTYSITTGNFYFGKEKCQLTSNAVTYERQTDASLPSVQTEEVEEMDEGGYPDTKEVQS